jgi:hypothetical protein
MNKTEKSVSGTEQLFYSLLHAETEDSVTEILKSRDLLSADNWKPLGEMENNWSMAGNQQTAAAAALVEKVVNGIDAVLIHECLKRGIDPESNAAPSSMGEAARLFFEIPNGRLENLDARDRTSLAEMIQLIAVGSKSDPNYLIVDKGEGQTPGSFPETFLSLAKSNKLRIPFVQGKYNAGGTGALRFCGRQNYQLLVSRRAPDVLSTGTKTDESQWGFTLIRRLRPTEGDARRNSVYVYLAPAGEIPRFEAESITVCAGDGAVNKPPTPYSKPLEFGTCLKLYNYRWKAIGTATLDPRYELNKYLYNLVLPVRVTETRSYKANYYSTTVSGGSVDENVELDLGPASGSIALPGGMGTIPVELKVFKDKKADGSAVDTRHLPNGVIFTVNGQMHGALHSNFVSRKLNYSFLEDYLLLVVDATNMPADFREDFFMTSRDRLAEGNDRDFIENEIKEFLKSHDGLRDLNNRRKQEAVSKTVEQAEPLDVLQELINHDPSLAALFGTGNKLKTPFGPKKEEIEFPGKRFPTFFRLKKESLLKECPINRTCRVEMETDAADDYFTRGDEPGIFAVTPRGLDQGFRLYHGWFSAKFCPPINANVDDAIDVEIQVVDPSRETNPFANKFRMTIGPKETTQSTTKTKAKKKEEETGGVSLPPIREVTREKWSPHKFDQHSGVRYTGGVDGEELEAFVNVDNIYFLNELARLKDETERPLLRHYFKYGLVLVTLGMIQDARRRRKSMSAQSNGTGGKKVDEEIGEDLDTIARLSGGIAAVIIPVVRNLAATAAKIAS